MELISSFLQHPDLTYLLLIPVISGVIGLVTNAIGIQMMFRPINFVGIKPFFGWQGIIPSRAKKFARLQMDQVEKIVDVGELLESIDPIEINNILQPDIRQLIEAMIDEAVSKSSPIFWENTPYAIKSKLYSKVEREMPGSIDSLFQHIKSNHEAILDSKQMVIDKLDKEKHILVELIQKIVNKELGFLIKSGLTLGFIFGIFQMALFYQYPGAWYVLPIGGFAVGYLTNWVAIKLLFQPIDPIKIGPFSLQGLFLKRKSEVAVDYAETITKSVLNAQTVAEYILSSDNNSPLNKWLRFHISKTIDKSLGRSKHILLPMIGTENYIELKAGLLDQIRSKDNPPPPVTDSIAYVENSINLSEVIQSRMKAFSPLELDRFVRPIFEEDEWILYIVGGALGFVAGGCQFVMMFSG